MAQERTRRLGFFPNASVRAAVRAASQARPSRLAIQVVHLAEVPISAAQMDAGKLTGM
ncbi:protein of unknown function (plasmid) [Cupriavidus taiwanensis]|nr:protein of unknown function [Cupriavidus taiwanensis]